MWFINYIISALTDLSEWFYEGWRVVSGWVWPFNQLSTPLWYAKEYFRILAIYFGYAGDWLDDIWYKVQSIFNFSDIYSYFKDFFDAALNAWTWVRQAPTFIINIINTWWSTALQQVQAWVLERVTVLYGAINYWSQKITNLRAEWDSFAGMIPTFDWIISWWGNWTGNVTSVITTWWTGALLEVQGLINTAFIERQSFWAGWQDWRGKVIEFFGDPLGWLESRFTNWFLGAE